MKVERERFGIGFIFICSFMFWSITISGQKIVGLDNWYNNEINAKTGKSFHYLWNDSAFSGYSQWGDLFKKEGAQITTIGRPNKKILGKLSLYIIVDPDTTSENAAPKYLLSNDIDEIVKWVKRGGVLVLLANDPKNCEFTHLNFLAQKFGMTFDHTDFHKVTGSQWNMGAFTSLPNHPLFNGVTKIYLKEISSISLTGTAKPILTENGKVFMAECNFGKGFVFAVGDPWLYNEYIDHATLPNDFDNLKAAENLTKYLLNKARLPKSTL